MTQRKKHPLSAKGSDPVSSQPIWAPHNSASEQKSMSPEQALRHAEKRNDLAVRGLSVGLWDWDIVTNDLYWSPRLKDIIGINNSSFRPHLKEFMERLHPEDESHTLACLKNHLERRGPYDVEYRLRRADDTYVWIHACGQAEWDEYGRPLRMVGSVDDISKRKAIEIERDTLIEKLAESNVELDRFASIAAHDMQAPLRVIVNFSTMVIAGNGDGLTYEGKQYLNLLIESAQHMQLMVDDLLEFARVGNEKNKTFDVFNPNKELARVLKNLDQDITCQHAAIVHDSFPQLYGSASQFRRMLENLIGNALKYQRSNVSLKLSIAIKDCQTHWQFCVKDNGLGIDDVHLETIFEPYTRLHPQCGRTGTGLGLAICKKIVKNHGGEIWATSKVGKGSSFFFSWKKQIKSG